MQYSDLQHWSVWQDAAKREAIDIALRGLYADLAAAVAERRPVCNASGRCCKFETYGHRLYVTGLEIAWFRLGVAEASGDQVDVPTQAVAVPLQQLTPTPSPQRMDPKQDACPYQIDGLCSTHTIRPLGCRVYFCEEGTEAWQQDTTELFLNRLKQLHEAHDLPYSYMEWRAGLAEAQDVLEGSA